MIICCESVPYSRSYDFSKTVFLDLVTPYPPYSQNGQRLSPKLRSLGYRLRIFQNEVWAGILKIPAKICIFEETHNCKVISQLSVEHYIFHLELMSVVAVVVQTLFIMLLKIWDVARKKENTFQLLPYKN